jgi:hypothetical protein
VHGIVTQAEEIIHALLPDISSASGGTLRPPWFVFSPNNSAAWPSPSHYGRPDCASVTNGPGASAVFWAVWSPTSLRPEAVLGVRTKRFARAGRLRAKRRDAGRRWAPFYRPGQPTANA